LKTAITLIIIFFTLGVVAQEPLMPELPEQDSELLETEQEIVPGPLLPVISPLSNGLQPMKLPEFNFNDAVLQRWNYDISGYSFNSRMTTGFHHGYYNIIPVPFVQSGTIFSQGSYQINDKFKVGGYSFGANSIFSAPLPNQNLNNFDFRGSTLFMEYKVSDKFKIETRVSVSQGR
jgi:hypothetical protein